MNDTRAQPGGSSVGSRAQMCLLRAPRLDPFNRQLAITPDGSSIVFTGGADPRVLFVRPLDQLDVRDLNAPRPFAPFVSPDGQWVGLSSGDSPGDDGLYKIAITGGASVRLATLDSGRGAGSWGPGGTIVFATATWKPACSKSSKVTARRPFDTTRPRQRRGRSSVAGASAGRAVLFTITHTTGDLGQVQVAVLDLGTGTYSTLIRGATDAGYVPSGHLVYGARGALWAVTFDLSRLSVVGTPLQVVRQIVTNTIGGLMAAVAPDGTLVHIPGTATPTLVWVDRNGREMPIPIEPQRWEHPRISPDGARIALSSQDGDNDIWVMDLVRGGLTRLTSDPATDFFPVWARDGNRIFFSSSRGGARNLYARAADGTGDDRRLTESSTIQDPNAMSPDGRHSCSTKTTTYCYSIWTAGK